MLRIGLIQMRCEKDAAGQNLAYMASCLQEAARLDAQVVAFPEMCIRGYADPHKFPGAVQRLDGPDVLHFLRLTESCPAVVLAGMIEENPAGKPFITQLAARRGRLLAAYRKITIRDEEEEWFSPGDKMCTFRHAGLTCGLAVCADIHNPAVYAGLARQGAQLVFELAAPGLYGGQETRDWQSGYAWWEGECRQHLGRYAQEHALWIAAVTQAGRTVDEDFPGGGFVFTPSGERLFSTPDGRPCAAWLDIDLESGRVSPL